MVSSWDYAQFKRGLEGSGCHKCGLSEGRTRIVVDRGNSSADVLIVGEAPGQKEDLSGRAFVGRSGQLLDRMMAEAGFDTEQDALVVNIVKCRPPKNRPPTREEARTCLPYLKQQIEIVRPRWAILLGATAVRHLLPEHSGLSMAEAVGTFFEAEAFPGVRLTVFYHPAYILRDPRKKGLMRDCIGRFVSARKRDNATAGV